MNDEQLEKIAEIFGWEHCTFCFDLTECQIEKYKDKISWHYVCLCQKLTLEQIIKYKDYINISELLKNKYIDNSIKDKIKIGVFYK